MMQAAVRAFLWRGQSWAAFSYPALLAHLVVFGLGVLYGLNPENRAARGPHLPSLRENLIMMGLGGWLGALAFAGVLRFLMTRDYRWDGQGRMLNLVAASWLIPMTLAAGLMAWGVAPMLTLPLWLYALAACARAADRAMPEAGLPYCVGAVVASTIAGIAVWLVTVIGSWFLVYVLI
ncbi:hypothetical protein ACILG0_11645, partial [Pseudomonadota bacterium AL_CKDN230030165-1A_HGKHYDSX7]